jgi:hypothetical protein
MHSLWLAMGSIWVNANHCGKQWNLSGAMQTIVASNGIYLGQCKPLWLAMDLSGAMQTIVAGNGI